MVGTESVKDHPLFIPPRKRQSSKKNNTNPNYVDHIVTSQVSALFSLISFNKFTLYLLGS